jgi:hypothetical protein
MPDPGLRNDNPLCQDPNGDYSHTQYYAKAYPGLRHLSVAKSLGANAALGSICPRTVTDATAQDFGYRAALDGLLDQMNRSFAR